MCLLVPMRTVPRSTTLLWRREVTMEQAFWVVIVYAYVFGVLGFVGFAIVRMFGGFHHHQH
jgi:hypothetical protein